ncbi:MAG: hypothetical protein Fur0010_15090 [Bdellovibrio sp.]
MKFFFPFILLFAKGAFAQVEYSAESLFRHYPLAVFVKGHVGFGIKIWDKSEPKKEFLYGNARALLIGQTSGTLSSYHAEAHFAPIAILDFYSGFGHTTRMLDKLPSFDCDVVNCKDSSIFRTYTGARFAFALHQFYLMSDSRFTTMTASKSDRVLADELSSLLANPGKDQLTQNTTLIGYKFFENYSVGFLNQYNAMKNFKNTANMAILFLRQEKDEWSWLAGPGFHHDRNNHAHPTFLLNIKWTGNKGVALF